MSAQVISFPAQTEKPQATQDTKETLIKADCEQGFTRIANTLLDAVCEIDLNGSQHRVFMAIIRKTYGYQKKTDWFTASQIAEQIKFKGNTTYIRRVLRELKERNLIIEVNGKTGPNPVISEWIFNKEGQKKAEPNGSANRTNQFSKQNQSVLKKEPVSSTQKKENNTKENIKDNTVGKPDRVCEESIQYLNFKTGKRFRETANNLSMVRKLLDDGYTPSDIRKVIDRQTAKWLHDSMRNQYLRPKTLFEPTNFESYLNAGEVTNQRPDQPTQAPNPREQRQMINDAIDDIYDTNW